MFEFIPPSLCGKFVNLIHKDEIYECIEKKLWLKIGGVWLTPAEFVVKFHANWLNPFDHYVTTESPYTLLKKAEEIIARNEFMCIGEEKLKDQKRRYRDFKSKVSAYYGFGVDERLKKCIDQNKWIL